MSGPSVEKKFEARIPVGLWNEYETWLEGRGRVDNGTLMEKLLRLFLDLPERTQLQLLFGKEPPALIDCDAPITPDEDERPLSHRISAMTKVARSLPREYYKLLSPEEQSELNELRARIGPAPQEQAETQKRKEKRA